MLHTTNRKDLMMETPNASTIQKLRVQNDLTQEEAAEMVHVNGRTWQTWEGGFKTMKPVYWDLFQLKVSLKLFPSSRLALDGISTEKSQNGNTGQETPPAPIIRRRPSGASSNRVYRSRSWKPMRKERGQ